MKNSNDSNSNEKAVIFAREASAQSDGRSSIPRQLQACREYAQYHGLEVEREIVEQGMAAHRGSQTLVRFLKEHPELHNLIAERTDRLARNLSDCMALTCLPIQIHLVKEEQNVAGTTGEQFAEHMFGMVSGYYAALMRKKIREGVNSKLEQGDYPSRAPFGYQNNQTKRSIEVHPKTAPIVQRIFKLYATGHYSLPKLQKVVSESGGVKLSTKRLHRILGSPFYRGVFVWKGRHYNGGHQSLVGAKTHGKVQRLLAKTSASSVGCGDAIIRLQGKK